MEGKTTVEKRRKNEDSIGEKAAKAGQARGKSARHDVEGQAEAAESESSWIRGNYLYIIIAVAIIAVAAVSYILYSGSLVSFQAFRNNYIGAPHVAVVVTFRNSSGYSNLSECYLPVIENLARVKKLGTIDLYVINASNSTCTYSLGLGKTPINISNTTSGACLSRAAGEPGIYLNYSMANSTRITPTKLVINGNSAYMRLCPIAADIG